MKDKDTVKDFENLKPKYFKISEEDFKALMERSYQRIGEALKLLAQR